ncbi:hypothetical protein CNMCM5793_006960 [Aspergillus hiratsukae]|uniref:Uncharacterized protein n=1 Tax=Aspergillus hiratsukae TaxID=1194566 RepID=A0A8H6PHJ1_9EURO|nr:hypothetical protein CNMCM5793_006960 [Aspergillus hiratsukae]
MLWLVSLCLWCCVAVDQAYARAVFAHFMVSNTAGYAVTDWENEITLAMDAHIDAFALNMAYNDDTNDSQLPNAFTAAQNLGFSLFLSFDYAGNGPWPQGTVLDYLIQWTASSAYYFYQGQPFVSTFEGSENAADWVDVKSLTASFFMPDWSSLGAKAALELQEGIADGLLSWAAWPYGPNDMDTYVDASYIQYLAGKPYMMPVSPWFFTNMPGYDKNWLWRGDDLWYDRWQQVHYLAPEFVEILTWNDFGESHYIGPIVDSHSSLADTLYTAFTTGEAPYNYAEAFSHDGWRAFLPFVIDMYKNNETLVEQEGISAWYRLNAAGACANDGNTTGNTASQLQLEYWPYQIPQNKIFFSALLASPAEISVTIGGTSLAADWVHTPSNGVGLYHGSVSYSGYSGQVMFTVTRSGSTVVSLDGEEILQTCWQPTIAENWNAWTGFEMASGSVSASPTSLDDEVCVAGWGIGDFNELCAFTCSLGYCPVGACVCSALGEQPTLPDATGIQGYPAAGKDANYAGLCSFACNYGYCPSDTCGTAEVPLTVPTVSPFTPDTCVAGTGNGDLAGLCSYACNFGFCPIHSCSCTVTGPLNVPPTAIANLTGWAASEVDSGLCQFACSRGYCPSPVCTQYNATSDYVCGASDEDFENDVDCGDTPTCDYSISYSDMDALQASLGDIDTACIDFYMVGALYGELQMVLDNYTSLTSNVDYDSKFTDYVKAVQAEVPAQLQYFMNDSTDGPVGEGNKYFQCILQDIGRANETATSCPIDANYMTNSYTIYYELLDEDGFFGNLTATFGIEQDWVVFGTDAEAPTCLPGDYPDGCWTLQGYPMAADSSSYTVANPKDIITSALPNMPTMQSSMLLTQMEMGMGDWGGLGDDVVQAYSTAVFMLAEAIDRMENVISIATDWENEQAKQKILDIVMIVLLVVPFLGELDAISDSLIGLARMLELAGAVGNTGLDLYTVIEDPEMAPMVITQYLFRGGSREPSEFSDMAAARRKMTDDDEEALGAVFRSKSIQETALGPEHPDTLTSVSNLGSVLKDQGKYEEAEVMHRRALEGSEKALGPEHPDTLVSVSHLGSVLEDQGKYEEAEAMYREL